MQSSDVRQSSGVTLRRRTFLGICAVAGVTATIPAGARPAAAADPTVAGLWEAPFPIGGQAIHAALMRTGDVLFFSYIEGSPTVDHTSYVGTWNWATNLVRTANYSYPRDVFCAGMNLLPDGRLFVAGGHAADTGKRSDPVGASQTDTYDPLTRTWTPGPVMGWKRWYPISIGLSDGLSYIFGGSEEGSSHIVTVEVFDPITRSLRVLPSTANKSLGWYPRMHAGPDQRVAKVGPARRTVFFDPRTNLWATGPNMVVGARTLGTSVMLSGGSRVLAFGGHTGTAPPTPTAEILDLSVSAPVWRSTGSLTYGRIHPNAVMLPTGQVLAVGGGLSGKTDGPIKSAELYDPDTGTWSLMAAQQAGRMYHSTAILLPDGRVFSGGQVGTFANTAELFSPPYLFRGPRPAIGAADSTVTRGQAFTIVSPDAGRVASVALVKAGSVTHQVNTDQRRVPLSFMVNGDTITAGTPSNVHLLPPGYYLLFLVDYDGVPSIAPWIRVL